METVYERASPCDHSNRSWTGLEILPLVGGGVICVFLAKMKMKMLELSNSHLVKRQKKKQKKMVRSTKTRKSNSSWDGFFFDRNQ